LLTKDYTLMTKIRLQFADVNKSFAEWLKAARKKSYLSMETLGAKVGVSKQYISVLEKGDPHPLTNKPVKPKREVVEKIAETTGADLNEGLQAAGYAIEINIPEKIIIEGFAGFDESDVDKMVAYIRFTKEQKKKEDQEKEEQKKKDQK
jgi:transcriptional regulator with XRE-family HTH domain